MTTKKLLLSAALICFLTLVSCNKKVYETPVIDFKSYPNKIDLPLSEIVTDLKIVPLETRDNLLLSNNAAIAISEKYIVTSNRTELHLFDKEGKHVRVLAVQGGGPNEFSQITGFIIDDKNDILYYKDFVQMGETLKRVNLRTGEHLETMNFGEKAFFAESVDNNGRLYGIDASRFVFRFINDGSEEKESGSTTLFSIFDPKNGERKDIETSNSYTPSSASKKILTLNDEAIVLNLAYSDTLYSYQNNELAPKAIFSFENKMTDMSKGGEGIELNLMTSKGVILGKSTTGFQSSTSSGGAISIRISTSVTDHVYLSNNGEYSQMRSIYLEPFGYRAKLGKNEDESENDTNETAIILELPRYSSGYAYYFLDAIKFIQLLEYAIESKDVPENLKKEYREHLATIDEENNPVLIIGKVK